MPRFLGQSVPRHERMVSRGAWCETWTEPTAWQTNEAELLQFQALGFLNFFFANILLRFFKQGRVELSCKPSMPPKIKSDIIFPYQGSSRAVQESFIQELLAVYRQRQLFWDPSHMIDELFLAMSCSKSLSISKIPEFILLSEQ